MQLQTNFPGDPAPLSVFSGCPRPRADTPDPPPQPMDLRVGQRPPVEPPPEPALLALQPPQHLHHHLFLAGLQQPRSVEPMRVKTELPAHVAALSSAPRPSPSLQPLLDPCPSPQLLAPSWAAGPAHSSQWIRRCPSCRWGSRSKSCGSFSIRTRASEVRREAFPAGGHGRRHGPVRVGWE